MDFLYYPRIVPVCFTGKYRWGAQQAAIFGYGMVPARLFGALLDATFPIRLAAGQRCLPLCSCMGG